MVVSRLFSPIIGKLTEVFTRSSYIGGVGVGGAVKSPEVDCFAINHDFGLPFVPLFVPSHPLKTGGIPVKYAGVRALLTTSSKSQIGTSVISSVSVLMIDLFERGERSAENTRHDNSVKIVPNRLVVFARIALCINKILSNVCLPTKNGKVSVARIDERDVSLSKRDLNGIGEKIKLNGSRIGGMIIHSGLLNRFAHALGRFQRRGGALCPLIVPQKVVNCGC
jgi:hypothetical protein